MFTNVVLKPLKILFCQIKLNHYKNIIKLLGNVGENFSKYQTDTDSSILFILNGYSCFSFHPITYLNEYKLYSKYNK
jgi:hypothetical protein